MVVVVVSSWALVAVHVSADSLPHRSLPSLPIAELVGMTTVPLWVVLVWPVETPALAVLVPLQHRIGVSKDSREVLHPGPPDGMVK